MEKLGHEDEKQRSQEDEKKESMYSVFGSC